MSASELFTPERRAALREDLIARAEADPRIVAAAITGSVAGGTEDRWSDIDLAFAVADGASIPEVIALWTETMEREAGAVATLDVPHGPTTYRVFLLADGLQVDIAFSPAAEFRALAPTFRLLFGEAAEPRHAPDPTPERFVGLAWLHALHVRSALARGKVWQADWMLRGMRDAVLSLACVRHGVPAYQGRGLDALPEDVRAARSGTLPRSLDPAELARAFGEGVDAFIDEVGRVSEAERARLEPTLRTLAATVSRLGAGG